MKKLSFYDEAHIFVAALRLFEFTKSGAPGYSDIGDITGMNTDRVSYLAARLRDAEIIDIVEGAFSNCLIIKDHLKIEELPREIPVNKMADEINRFKESSKNELEEKVRVFTEEKKKKEQQLFEEIQNKFKKELEKE